MTRINSLALWGWVAIFLTGSAVHAVATDKELLAQGLVKSGTLYVLPAETEVLAQMPELRKLKKEADDEKRAHKSSSMRISNARTIISTSKKEYTQLEGRLGLTTNVQAHNRIVLRMNALVAKMNDTTLVLQDLEDDAKKLSSDAGVSYVDQVQAAGDKADAVSKKYEELARNSSLKSALALLGVGYALGPSVDFASAAADLVKWRSEIDSEAIPMTEDHGTFTVSALLNGESFNLTVDVGASSMMLPSEIADKLKVTPGPKDPIIKMKVADGRIIEGQEIVLKSVRVGRFTIKDVECVVLPQKSEKEVGGLLGNSFLGHFVVKMDQKAGQLHLTETEPEKKAAATAKPTLEGSK